MMSFYVPALQHSRTTKRHLLVTFSVVVLWCTTCSNIKLEHDRILPKRARNEFGFMLSACSLLSGGSWSCIVCQNPLLASFLKRWVRRYHNFGANSERLVPIRLGIRMIDSRVHGKVSGAASKLLCNICRVPPRTGKPWKPWKIKVHLKNLEKSWNFVGVEKWEPCVCFVIMTLATCKAF